MMVAERGEFLAETPGNKGNGYRPEATFGSCRKLEFRIPRDRYGNFHPQILAILRDQEEECDRFARILYTQGLTQEQVADVFGQIYGQHYSKSSISRMVDCVRIQVSEWLERGPRTGLEPGRLAALAPETSRSICQIMRVYLFLFRN